MNRGQASEGKPASGHDLLHDGYQPHQRREQQRRATWCGLCVLNGVSWVASTSCVTVGNYVSDRGRGRMLAEQHS
jgi:hypothetical protein